MLGGTCAGGPPVTTVPLPVRLMVRFGTDPLAVMFNVGNEPVAPAYAPVPSVIVADPVPDWPEMALNGRLMFPLMLSVPLLNAMVKGTVRFWPPLPRLEADPVALKVPLPMFVSVAGPLTVMLRPNETVAFVTVKVVLIVVAAWAAADNSTQANSARIIPSSGRPSFASCKIRGKPVRVGS